ncbi:MAG: Xaa-Pro peptidase family protein [Sphingomonas sp.]
MVVPAEEYRRRVARVQEQAIAEGFGGLIFYSRPIWQFGGNVRYLSGLYVGTRREYLVIPAAGEPILILPTRNSINNARKVTWIEDIRAAGETTEIFVDVVSGTVAELGFDTGRIGVVGMNDLMPAGDYRGLIEAMPEAELVDATHIIDEMRLTKSEYEIAAIEETAGIADDCYDLVRDFLREGVNERDLIARCHGFLAGRGCTDLFLLTARGRQFNGYIDPPRDFTFSSGDNYIFSLEVAGPQRHWTQIVRPMTIGPGVSNSFRELHDIAMEGLASGVAAFKAGNRVGDIANAIEDKVRAFDCQTNHWSGHGMGLDVAEAPAISPDNDMIIRPGMVLTIHPLISRRGDKSAGTFVGDTYVLEAAGPRNLSRWPCSLDIV